jgi:vancomycin permeability regulator SanA
VLFKRLVKMSLKIGLSVLVLSLILFGLPRLITALHSRPHISSPDKVVPKPVAIVFGAGLWRDGSPTPVLRDRVATAAQLYFEAKVEKILMSGSNQGEDYNEPEAMRDYAISLGVPHEDIVLDYAGRRTYDTCYRARDIFGVSEAILVTQGFHLPRALYLCNVLGISASGVPADQRIYRHGSETFWKIRELPATLVALWELHVSKPLPMLGEREPIFPDRTQVKQKTG